MKKRPAGKTTAAAAGRVPHAEVPNFSEKDIEMALPPLPENNTARLFLTYTTGTAATAQEHTVSIRYNAAQATPSDIMLDLAEAMEGETLEAQLFEGWRFLSAETQAAGSQVRLPVTLPGALAGILGTGNNAPTPPDQAREVRLIGRGLVSGRRVSMSFFGIDGTAIAEQDFRFTPAGGTLLFSIRGLAAALAASGAAFTSIAGDATTWYAYVNWQFNSHWETEQRA
jgi:hypothetical protein